MRILHLSKYYPPEPGGIEHIVACQAEGAQSAGHDVTVVCGAGPGKAGPESIEELRGVRVVRLPTYAVIWSQPIIKGYLKHSASSADIVHVHHPNPLADIAALTRVTAPVVITHHSDVRRQRLIRPFYMPLVRAVHRKASAIAVPTRSHVTISNELRGFEDKCHIIPFGVDEARFSPGEVERPAPFGAFGDRPVGLFVGRLANYKGLDVLVNAVRGTELAVVIVGAGELGRWLEQKIKRLGVESNVSLAGAVSARELPDYYRAAAYFVLPSTTPAEMFGVCLAEAMACGTPIITTALKTGVREVNAPGEVGLEVQPGDATGLQEAMEKLAGDSSLRREMGLKARKRVEERFTLRGMIDAHLRLYAEILSAA